MRSRDALVPPRLFAEAHDNGGEDELCAKENFKRECEKANEMQCNKQRLSSCQKLKITHHKNECLTQRKILLNG